MGFDNFIKKPSSIVDDEVLSFSGTSGAIVSSGKDKDLIGAATSVASSAEVTTGTENAKYISPLALSGAGITVAALAPPAKAIDSEVTTGTDDAKFVTSLALAGAGVTPIKSKATATELNAGTDDAKFATALGLTNSNFTKAGPAGALTSTLIPANDGGINLGTALKRFRSAYFMDNLYMDTMSASSDQASVTSLWSLFTTGSSDRTQTLPSGANQDGNVRFFIKIDSGIGALIISPATGTINGATTIRTVQQYAGAIIVSNGTNWYALLFGTWT